MSAMKPHLIAVDGPVAVGKSTVGLLLAKKLGYSFVDSGSLYRALTWKALKLGFDLEDENKLTMLTSITKIELANRGRAGIFVDGKDISRELRHPEVEKNVYLVSRLVGVRKGMLEKQRKMAKKGKVIMAGRDIGTVVLPQAGLKIFLTASPKVRAHRRYLELSNRGEKVSYESILEELMRRDRMDRQRMVSPLKLAKDAKIIDTESLTSEQVVNKMLDLMEV